MSSAMTSTSSIFGGAAEPEVRPDFARNAELPSGAFTAEQAGTWLARLVPQDADQRLRTIPGRETSRVEWEGRPLVIKRLATDSFRERWYDRLHSHAGRTPGQREFDNLVELRKLGFPVPAPLLWARDSTGRSVVAMEHVAHDEDLSQRLARADPKERSEWEARLAMMVAMLHRSGFYHRDLYHSHFVLRPGTDELVLLDLGRARQERRPRTRWFVKDLAALEHSRPYEVTDGHRLDFLSHYLGCLISPELGEVARVGDRELRAFANAVSRKARRLAAHRPKFSDTETFRPSPAGEGSTP